MRNDPVAAIVAKLEQGGFDPQSTGPDSWESRCPAHDGSRRNLSIKTGSGGRVLIYCHHEPRCYHNFDHRSLGAKSGGSLS